MASYLLKGAYILTRPVTKVGEVLMYPFTEEQQQQLNSSEASAEEDLEPSVEQCLQTMSLEGTLSYRKGGGAGKRFTWKRRYVVLDMTEGGSLSVFRLHETKILKQMYTKLHRQMSTSDASIHRTQSAASNDQSKDVLLHLPPNAPWVVKDVPDSSSLFVLEISTSGSQHFHFDNDDCDDLLENISIAEGSFVTNGDFTAQHSEFDDDDDHEMDDSVRQKLEAGLQKAKQKHRPMRFYFRCPRKSNEKALWLRAFSKIDRLALEPSSIKKPLSRLANALFIGDVRKRTLVSERFAKETIELDRMGHNESSALMDDSDVEVSLRNKGSIGVREFRVHPTYAYPHVWMTNKELKAEMELKSTKFHDLRLNSTGKEEIGVMKIEVLQCIGLPKLDRKSETDAVVYLVCGSYAFSTDVIKETSHPMWLRKTRRACIFPVYHAYARLYCGVFDDDRGEQDDFAGRVVIDLARLRPGSLYDVTLPLRTSAHVYSRRPRGAIRLRFQIDWKSERAALMSYIPEKLELHRDLSLYKPREDVTVMCADEKSFRNVAMTVHGYHLPGKFSFNQFRATLREIALTRKAIMMVVRLEIKAVITWENPAISLYVFLAWMHCIYANQCSLVPAYAVLFILLQMIRCYARYGIDGPAQLGFLPPTWEEMLSSLVFDTEPDSYCIEPIDLRHATTASVRSAESVSLPSIDSSGMVGSDDFKVSTHEPQLKSILHLWGFLDKDDHDPTNTHLEFPYARSTDYPKYSVEEALVTNDGNKKEVKARARRNRNNRSDAYLGNSSKHFGGPEGSPRSKWLSKIAEPRAHELYTIPDESYEDDDDLNGSFTLSEESGSNKMQGLWSRSGSRDEWEEDDPGMVATDASDATAETPQLPLFMQLPEQDIDKEGEGTGNTLPEDLSEIKYKMHELTMHLFNDRAYAVKNPDGVFFGHENRASRKGEYNINRHIERSLRLGQYSHGNPILARLGLYLEPIIGSALSFLCFFRALFNVYTWRDPMLSFWVSLVLSALTAVLFVFPWRIALFLAGLVVVGPQNYVFRKIRMRRERDSPPSAISQPTEEKPPVDVDELIKEQPVVKAHATRDQKPEDLDLSKVNRREIQHVVVPYSQLMYQRFYDWPPEPQYARVKRVNGSSRPTTAKKKPLHVRSASGVDEKTASSVRPSRLFRASSDGHDARPRANTAPSVMSVERNIVRHHVIQGSPHAISGRKKNQ